MKKAGWILSLTFVFTLIIGWYNLQYTEAAIPVVDWKNIAETIKTWKEMGRTADNTDDMLENQVKNLTSLSKGFLESIKNKITGENGSISGFLETVNQIQGLAADFEEAEDSWNQTFESIENIYNFTADAHVQHGYKMTNALDSTYRDTLKIQGIVAQIEQDQKTLDELMKANANAEGAKAVGQTANQLTALLIAQMMRNQEIMAAISRADVAQKAYQNQVQIEAQAMAAKESAAWQETGNRTNEEIRLKTGKNNKGPMGDL